MKRAAIAVLARYQAAVVLARYRIATEFPTDNALQQYLSKHPKADRKKHSVKPKSEGQPAEKAEAQPADKAPSETAKAPEKKPAAKAEAASKVTTKGVGSGSGPIRL